MTVLFEGRNVEGGSHIICPGICAVFVVLSRAADNFIPFSCELGAYIPCTRILVRIKEILVTIIGLIVLTCDSAVFIPGASNGQCSFAGQFKRAVYVDRIISDLIRNTVLARNVNNGVATKIHEFRKDHVGHQGIKSNGSRVIFVKIE